MSFADRFGPAAEHERQVAELMRARGWLVQPFGQALLSETIRNVIRRRKHLPLRWMPDMLCTRGDRDPVVVLIDAKTGRADTGNYALECDAYDAAVRWLYAMRVDDFWYVWHDFHRTSVAQITTGLARHDIIKGPQLGNGSGTPFYLIPKALEYRLGQPIGAA